MPQTSEIAFVSIVCRVSCSTIRTGNEVVLGVSGLLARGGFPDNVVDDITYYRLCVESVIAHVEAVEREPPDRRNASFDCDETRCVDC